MSSEIDPKVVRGYARRAILSAVEDVDYMGVGEQFGDDENWPQDRDGFDTMQDAVYEAVKEATVIATWPDEQPQDERDGDVRAVADALDLIDGLWSGDARPGDVSLTRTALYERFADRIAALDARDAKGGEGR